MSILLDALKKSEEQRQLGKVPGIHSPVEGPPPNVAGQRRWIPWLLVSGIVLIVIWTAWRQFGPPDPQPVSAPNSAQLVATPSGVAGEADVTDPALRAKIEAPVSGAKVPGRSPVEELPTSEEAVGPEITARPAKVSQQGEPRKSQVNKSFTAYETPPEVVSAESVAEQEQVPAPAMAKDIMADPSKKSAADKQKPSAVSRYRAHQFLGTAPERARRPSGFTHHGVGFRRAARRPLPVGGWPANGRERRVPARCGARRNPARWRRIPVPQLSIPGQRLTG